jgi:hypothetical protein
MALMVFAESQRHREMLKIVGWETKSKIPLTLPLLAPTFEIQSGSQSRHIVEILAYQKVRELIQSYYAHTVHRYIELISFETETYT